MRDNPVTGGMISWNAVESLAGEPSPEAFYALGVVAAVAGALDQAEDWLGKALRQHPGYWQAQHSLATVLAEQGRLEEAASHYSKALETQPGSVCMWREMGRTVCRLGASRDAIETLERGRRAVIGSADAFLLLHDLGRLLLAAGRADEAIAVFRDAVAQQPTNPHLRSSLGTALAVAGERKAAEEQLTHALRIKPDLSSALLTLGVLQLEKGNLDASIELLERAREAAPEDAMVHRKLALAYHRRQLPEQAEQAMQQALELAGS